MSRFAYAAYGELGSRTPTATSAVEPWWLLHCPGLPPPSPLQPCLTLKGYFKVDEENQCSFKWMDLSCDNLRVRATTSQVSDLTSDQPSSGSKNTKYRNIRGGHTKPHKWDKFTYNEMHDWNRKIAWKFKIWNVKNATYWISPSFIAAPSAKKVTLSWSLKPFVCQLLPRKGIDWKAFCLLFHFPTDNFTPWNPLEVSQCNALSGIVKRFLQKLCHTTVLL